eukprot:gene10338-12224_t
MTPGDADVIARPDDASETPMTSNVLYSVDGGTATPALDVDGDACGGSTRALSLQQLATQIRASERGKSEPSIQWEDMDVVWAGAKKSSIGRLDLEGCESEQLGDLTAEEPSVSIPSLGRVGSDRALDIDLEVTFQHGSIMAIGAALPEEEEEDDSAFVVEVDESTTSVREGLALSPRSSVCYSPLERAELDAKLDHAQLVGIDMESNADDTGRGPLGHRASLEGGMPSIEEHFGGFSPRGMEGLVAAEWGLTPRIALSEQSNAHLADTTGPQHEHGHFAGTSPAVESLVPSPTQHRKVSETLHIAGAPIATSGLQQEAVRSLQSFTTSSLQQYASGDGTPKGSIQRP